MVKFHTRRELNLDIQKYKYLAYAIYKHAFTLFQYRASIHDEDRFGEFFC